MIPLVCVSHTCPDGKRCYWRQMSFVEVKAANDAGRSRDCFQPGQVCPRALQRALLSMSGAELRWVQRIDAGQSDADLADAIGKEFGEWSAGSEGPGWTCMATGPRIWFGSTGDGQGGRRAPDLQGRALVAAVREFLGVPGQKATEQPWAGLPMFNTRG